MTEPPGGPAPDTGDPEIDAAVAGLDQLEGLPVADHHDVLAGAHDRLQRALDPDRTPPPEEPG